jgi:hypothetical protein
MNRSTSIVGLGVVDLKGGVENKFEFMLINDVIKFSFHLNQFFVVTLGIKEDHWNLSRIPGTGIV